MFQRIDHSNYILVLVSIRNGQIRYN